MKLDKNNQKVVLLSVIAILLLFVVFSFFLLPSVSQVKKLSSQIKEKNVDINKKSQEAKNFDKLQVETNKLQEELKVFQDKLIWNTDSSNFLEEFTRLAQDLQIEFVLLKPDKSVKVADKESAKIIKPAGKDKKAAQKEKKVSLLYSSLAKQPILVTLKSNYSDLVKFIKRIEESGKFIKIDSLKIESGQENIYQQSINLSLTIYNQMNG